MYLCEASIAHTKQFWNIRKYNNFDKIGEFEYFIKYRQDQILSIPFQFVLVAITHTKNTTGRLRFIENTF